MKKVLNILKLLVFAKLCIFTITFNTSTLALSSDWVINEKSKVRIISSKTATDKKNEIILGLEYALDPGWKTYWKSPGGGGFPQKLVWNNSSNIEDIKIDWPVPIEFEILGLKSLGYENKVIFPITLKLKNKNKDINLVLNTNYLVCKDICIPGNANLYLEIPSGKAEFTKYLYELEKTKSSLPIENINISPLYELKTQVTKKLYKIEISVTGNSNKSFIDTNIFIHTPFGLPVINPINNISSNLKTINSIFKFNSDQFSESKFPIEIVINDKNNNFKIIDNLEVKEISSLNNTSIYYILLISILGGLILNLMPCVLPVLSIKLLSVLNNQTTNFRLSFIYTAFGIVSSFLMLAVFFVLLKQIGISVAWGMQFQEPYFLIIILFILSIFCINTSGLFEIQLPNFISHSKILNIGNSYFTKNFFNGFFATLLATPCTAPFVGSAITVAFTQSAYILFIIFTLMGFGMSLPYIFVSVFPKTVIFLPKPGKWTIYIKYFLSFLLALTIIWILSILYNFYNYFFIIIYFFLLILLIFSFKINISKILISSITIIVLFLIPSISFFKQNNTFEVNEDWINFFDVNIDDIINKNQIVFVDVTADWCATCQFNKINVLNKSNIENIFIKNNIKLVRADWTKPNPEIDNFLKDFNKFGIPFNAFFSSEFPNGIILSEILTEKELIDSISKLK